MDKNCKKSCTVLMSVYNNIQCDARVQRSAETMHKMGFHVIVISCNSAPYQNDNFESIVFSKKQKGFRLLLSFWLFVLSYSLRNRKKIDLLYTHDYQMDIIGLFLSLLLKRKWVCDCHELLLQKKTYHEGLREKFFRILEKISIRSADLVIAANPERERIIRRIYRLKNTTSVGNIAPVFIKDFETIEKKEQLVYQGFLSKERDLSIFLAALKDLPADFSFKIIGDGPELENYKEQVSKEPVIASRVFFTGKISYQELLKESRECKIGVVVYPLDDRNCYYCSPNKLFEYIQMGIPVLVSAQPFLKKVVKEYHCGIVIKDLKNKDEISTAIRSILDYFDYYRSEMKRFMHDYCMENEMSHLRIAITNTFPEMLDRIKSNSISLSGM